MMLALLRAAAVAALLALSPTVSAHAAPPAHKLLVVSIDGLDWRYLRDRDKLGLAIPNLRRLLREGRAADGVVGVWPTVTWPSHTSIVTGVRPDQHGILTNGRPGNDAYWFAEQIKAPTLWDCATAAGRTTAAVTWPSTTRAKGITWNLPEWFKRRQAGSMDLESVAAEATPGLAAAITEEYPSFPQQWVDDRTRTLAVLHLLRRRAPDLILLHLVDLDAEAHERGPFEAEANATLEHTDELVGQMLAALPAGYRLVLTSDHGFERVDHVTNLAVLQKAEGAAGEVEVLGGVAVAKDAAAAAWLRGLSSRHEREVGREIPHEELVRYAPRLADAVAAFEPAPHAMFGRAASGEYLTAPREKGEHGFWPRRDDYRSTYIAWGPGVAPGTEAALEMVALKDRLAALMGLSCG